MTSRPPQGFISRQAIGHPFIQPVFPARMFQRARNPRIVEGLQIKVVVQLNFDEGRALHHAVETQHRESLGH